jgi:mono/diheme cytochrome c family protein
VKRHIYVLAAITCCWISALTTAGTSQPQAAGQATAAGSQAAPAQPPPPQGGGQRGGPPGTESGFATFQTRCSVCHGNPTVERAPSPAAIREMAPEKIYDALVSGPMQAQAESLTDPQKRAVSAALARVTRRRCRTNAPPTRR